LKSYLIFQRLLGARSATNGCATMWKSVKVCTHGNKYPPRGPAITDNAITTSKSELIHYIIHLHRLNSPFYSEVTSYNFLSHLRTLRQNDNLKSPNGQCRLFIDYNDNVVGFKLTIYQLIPCMQIFFKMSITVLQKTRQIFFSPILTTTILDPVTDPLRWHTSVAGLRYWISGACWTQSTSINLQTKTRARKAGWSFLTIDNCAWWTAAALSGLQVIWQKIPEIYFFQTSRFSRSLYSLSIGWFLKMASTCVTCQKVVSS